MSKATIYDVAGAARVSLATVSRAINNPEKVKPETRERVLKVIGELGYKPNAFARGLASRKSTTVAVVVPDMGRASIAEMMNGIADIARVYKYSILLYILESEEASEEDILREIIAAQVDGILYLNDEINEKQYDFLKTVKNSYQIPVVLTNTFYPESDEIPSVSIDYERAGYEIAKKLIEEGRKNIYMISTVRKYMVNDLKEAGYTRAMKEAGFESRIMRTSGRISINTEHFNEFFKDVEVDGVIAVRDSIAISFMNVAFENDVKIPENLGICGFQNTKYARLARPQLSCVDVPIYDMGAVGMRLLTKLMNSEVISEKVIKLPHSIVLRKTTL
ncbi:MAG: LacI family DNA-binding transcriptional regulator [Candidatus Izimaplasma sp.]|nr:LacI family DNA-binding transcriptional regulator [Candidatus Izimaplasma bacterium]